MSMSQHIQSVTVNEHGIVSTPVIQTIEGIDAAQLIKAHGETTVEFTTFQNGEKQEIVIDDINSIMASGTDLHYLASIASMDPGHMTSAAGMSENVEVTSEVIQSQPEEHTYEISLPLAPAPETTAVTVNQPTTRYHINTVKALKRTKEEVESGKKLYQCSGCGKESNFTSNLYKHMKTQHIDCVVEKLFVPEKRSLLNMPAVVSNNSESQNEKMSINNSPGKGIVYLKCSTCQKIFESVSEMKEHLKTHEVEISPLKKPLEDIDDGGMEFDNDYNDHTSNPNTVYVVKQDREGINAGKHLYSCSACGNSSDSTGNLYKHMQSMHADLTIERLIDPKRHSLESPRKVHFEIPKKMSPPAPKPSGPVVKVIKSSKEEIENGMRIFACSQCGKQSDFSSNLYKHMENFHPYHTIEKLINFTRTRSPAEPVELNTYRATDTNKVVYVIKSTNEEICNGEKPYRCSECGKGSEFTSNLYAHMDKQHSDCVVQTLKNNTNRRSLQPDPASLVAGNTTVTVVEVPADHMGKKYKCSRCYLTTTSTGSLYKHMRRMHKGFAIIKKQKPKVSPLKTTPKRRYTKRQKLEVSEYLEEYGYNDNYMSNEVEDNAIPTADENMTFNSFECCICPDLKSFVSMADLDLHVMMEHPEPEGNESNEKSDQEQDEQDGEVCSDEEVTEEEPKSDDESYKPVEENTISTVADGIRRSNRRRKAKSVWIIKNSDEESSQKGRHIYECSECGKGSDFTGNLYKHVKSNHVGYAIIKLEDEKQSPTKSGKAKATTSNNDEPVGIVKVIKSSVAEIKKGAKVYKCSLCGKAGDFTSNLYTHMKSAHKDHKIQRIWKGKEK